MAFRFSRFSSSFRTGASPLCHPPTATSATCRAEAFQALNAGRPVERQAEGLTATKAAEEARRVAIADIEMQLRRASSREEVIRLSVGKTRIELG